MDDYISRQAAQDVFAEVEDRYDPEWGNKRYTPKDVEEILDSVPPADVRSVVRGRWEITDNLGREDIKCSVCGCEPYWHPTEYSVRPYFCPNCGADMGEENNGQTDNS